MHVIPISNYPICGGSVESINHVLWRCGVVKETWRCSGMVGHYRRFKQLNIVKFIWFCLDEMGDDLMESATLHTRCEGDIVIRCCIGDDG